MTVGRQAGGHRCPDHRRDGWLNRLHRSRRPALRERLDVRNAAVVRELGQQIPIRSVEGEDRHARRAASRVATELGALHAKQRLAVGFESCDLECGDFQSARGEVARDDLTQTVALCGERRCRRQQIFDRNLRRHCGDRLSDARADPRLPSVGDDLLRVGNVVAGNAESQAIGHRHRHAFLRSDPDDVVELRPSVPLLEIDAVKLVRRQVRDALLHHAHAAGVLVDSEDQHSR